MSDNNDEELKFHIENWKMAWKGRDFELSHL